MSKAIRQGAVYRRLAAQARDAAEHCYLCGRPIDHSLPSNHPAAASADHITAMARGGHVHSTMVGTHAVCNLRRGDKDPSEVDFNRPLEWDQPPQRHTGPRHSQEW